MAKRSMRLRKMVQPKKAIIAIHLQTTARTSQVQPRDARFSTHRMRSCCSRTDMGRLLALTVSTLSLTSRSFEYASSASDLLSSNMSPSLSCRRHKRARCHELRPRDTNSGQEGSCEHLHGVVESVQVAQVVSQLSVTAVARPVQTRRQMRHLLIKTFMCLQIPSTREHSQIAGTRHKEQRLWENIGKLNSREGKHRLIGLTQTKRTG